MAETSHADWFNRWQALAGQYAGPWATAPAASGAEAAAGVPPQGSTQWPWLLSPAAGAQSETIERFLDSTRQYMTGMQSLFAAPGANAPAGNIPWANAFAPAFTAPGASMALFEHPMARAWRDMISAQAQAGVAPFAGSAAAPMNALPDPEQIKAWLRLPTFGPEREQQEHYQETAVAALEFQQQMSRYGALMLKASQRGFELFEGKLAECEQPGRQIESWRALYNLWVDAAEEGYAEIALSAEFREVQGALTNAQMRVRSLRQQDVEHVSAQLGMPTRSEVNTIGERLQALRREVRAYGGDALAGEIAALREEFSALKGTAQGQQPKPGQPAHAASTPAKTTRARAAQGKRAETAVTVRANAQASADAATVKSARKIDGAGRSSKTTSARREKTSVPSAAAKRAASKAGASSRTQASRAKKKAPRKTSDAVSAAHKPSAPDGQNFASRIARFADASLGASRVRQKQTRATNKPIPTRKRPARKGNA